MILFEGEKKGYFPSQFIEKLINSNFIYSNEKIITDLIQPASMDLEIRF